MILAAESTPSPLQLMLVTPESGIRKSPVCFDKPRDFRDSAGNRDREIPRFPAEFGREPEIGPGVPGRRAWGFLVFPGARRLSSL
jgi:hypothetical protein